MPDEEKKPQKKSDSNLSHHALKLCIIAFFLVFVLSIYQMEFSSKGIH
jgi:hypothetical protein